MVLSGGDPVAMVPLARTCAIQGGRSGGRRGFAVAAQLLDRWGVFAVDRADNGTERPALFPGFGVHFLLGSTKGAYMNPADYIFPAFFVLFVGTFVFRFIRHGSLTGAFLGGYIKQTVGEIALSKNSFSSRVLKIQTMDAEVGEEPCVALSIISKAPLGVSMAPFKLTATQAKELAKLLQQASGGRTA